MLLIWLSVLWVLAGDYCPGAPPPRLEIGMPAEVAPTIDRLRLRLLPAVGTGEQRLLWAATPFEVLAGPSCNGGYVWWRIQLADGVTGWVAEGTWSEYYIQPREPQTICQRIESPWLQMLLTPLCVAYPESAR
jgi:hypothetical protein